MNNEQNTRPANPVTKVLAIGRLTGKTTSHEEFLSVMSREVPATVELYLGGKIEQWWIKPDSSGVIFILNLTDEQEAHNALATLPLAVAGMMEFDLIPMGPLTPLRFLLNSQVAA